MDIFLDCEMTSIESPSLLSVGLVTSGGRRCYAELDLATPIGRHRLAQTPWDVREIVIDGRWCLVPGASCDSDASIGRKVGRWLLEEAVQTSGGRLGLLHDYDLDLEILNGALKRGGVWSRLSVLVSAHYIAKETGEFGPQLAAEATIDDLALSNQPLERHHALADALALRAAWRAWRLRVDRPDVFEQLLARQARGDEAQLYAWLATTQADLAGLAPLDVLDQADGMDTLLAALDEKTRPDERDS